MNDVFGHLLTSPSATSPIATFDDWRPIWTSLLADWPSSVDRALAAGFAADRLGWAFAGGYASAMQALAPGQPAVAALCATEDGGAHPRAIRTALVPRDGGFVVRGRKKFTTLATVAESLLVVASEGEKDGRNALRVVRVASSAPGVRIVPMPDLPFVPEIAHAEVILDDAPVDDVLPGDGYERYLKPFRTIEDVHVHAALLGWLIRVGRTSSWPAALVERAVALAAVGREVGARDAADPVTHVLLAGLLAESRRLVADTAPAWTSVDPDTRARWERDRPLLDVASKAREARRAKAWETLGRVTLPR